jgi:hypothetical protein
MTPAAPPPCIFPDCVSTDRHWHGPFPGGYDNPADPDGPPIPFTSEPDIGVRDYNGARFDDRPMTPAAPEWIDFEVTTSLSSEDIARMRVSEIDRLFGGVAKTVAAYSENEMDDD